MLPAREILVTVGKRGLRLSCYPNPPLVSESPEARLLLLEIDA